MSRELPILFNTNMVRAILDGKKTVTRRLMKPQPLFKIHRNFVFADDQDPKKWEDYHNILKTYQYKPGDILYVRETWAEMPYGYVFKADEEMPEGWDHDDRWRPSIHMPKSAARIWLRVTCVRIERLKDIMKGPAGPEHQIVREGFSYGSDFIAMWENTLSKYERNIYGWDANPWVWVIEFERCEKPTERGE